MTATSILDALVGYRIVPVVRTPSPETATTAVDWLCEAGFATFEITLTIPDALSCIKALAGKGNALIGAGTVLSAADARACIDAGARYIVSPSTVLEIFDVCREADIPYLPGTMTPTEVHAAMRAGAGAVKVFPASSAGGPGHLKALRSVFPHLRFCPTGGVDADNIQAYFKAGASFVGVGGNLVDATRIDRGEKQAFLDTARRTLAAAGDA